MMNGTRRARAGGRGRWPLLVISVLTVAAGPLAAQSTGWSISGSVSGNLMIGSDFLGGGMGADIALSRALAPGIALRFDAILVRLDEGEQSGQVVENTVVIFGVGPEAALSLAPVELYVRGLVGGAANRAGGDALGTRPSWATALGGGGGMRISIVPRLQLDVGGDVIKLGELDFADRPLSSLDRRDDPGVLRLRGGLRIIL